ncbi:MAG: zinc-ribbon domain-containing protein [Acidimicrobiia bacterium]
MALVCTSCGASARDDARFCASCGAALTRGCPGCGALVEPGARFCSSCGGALTETSVPVPSPSEERRSSRSSLPTSSASPPTPNAPIPRTAAAA